MSNQELTAYELHKNGKMLKFDDEFKAFLFLYKGKKYVINSFNEVITQEEDNMFGPENAYFPINQ